MANVSMDLLYAAGAARKLAEQGTSTFTDRLRLVIKAYGGTQQRFAERLNLAQSTVACWMMKETLSANIVKKIANACEGLNATWLVTGTGDMLTEIQGSTEEALELSRLLDKVPATSPSQEDVAAMDEISQIMNEVNIQQQFTDKDAQRKVLESLRNKIFVPVIGFSMSPEIVPGDTIAVSPLESFDEIDFEKVYYIIKKSGQKMLKHIQPTTEIEETLQVSAAMSDVRPSIIKKNDIERIFVVDSLYRSY